MCIPVTREQQAQASIRVGRGKVDMAHHGIGQFGDRLSIENRVKLLKAGADEIVKGQRGIGFHSDKGRGE